MFEEMRELASKQTALRSKTIVEMATINGARALGMEGQVGELSKSAFADLIAIPFTGKRTRVYDRVLEHNGDVVCNMIAGRWAISPQQIFQECSA
jgi:cytosine/adenosine deaminase-related metal-dependent hydrolase